MRSSGIEIGAAGTIFNQAHARDKAVSPECRIEVTTAQGRTRLTFHDLTPPNVDTTLSPADQYKQHGLDPTGNLLDPKHME
jgi:hypothetical protein